MNSRLQMNLLLTVVGVLLVSSAVSAAQLSSTTTLDATIPQLYGVSFSVATAYPNDYVTITLNASNYNYGYAYIYTNDSGSIYYITSIYIWLDNSTSGTFQINPYWRSGNYFISSIDLYSNDDYQYFNSPDNFTSPILSVYDTTPDTIGPQLSGITADRVTATVNETITFTFDITDDLSGFNYGFADLYTTNMTSIDSISIYYNGSSYVANWYVNPYEYSGDIFIYEVDLCDKVGNFQFHYNNSDFISPIINIYGTTPDSSPPVIVDAGFITTSVTTYSPTNISVYISASDDVSGLNYGYVDIYKINGSSSYFYGSTSLYPINSTTLLGSITMDFSTGYYYVEDAYVYDRASNGVYEYNGSAYTSNVLYVERFYDYTAPTVNSVWFSPAFTTSNNATFYANVTDSESGVQYVNAYLSSTYGWSMYYQLNHLAGDIWYVNFSPSVFGSGTFNITVDYVTVEDFANNLQTVYPTADMLVDYTPDYYIQYVGFAPQTIEMSELTTIFINETVPFAITEYDVSVDFYYLGTGSYYGSWIFSIYNGTTYTLNPSMLNLVNGIYGIVNSVGYFDTNGTYYYENNFSSDTLYINSYMDVISILYDTNTVDYYSSVNVHINGSLPIDISSLQIDYEFYDQVSNNYIGIWSVNSYTLDFSFVPADYSMPANSYAIPTMVHIWDINNQYYSDTVFNFSQLTILDASFNISLKLQSDHSNFQSSVGENVAFNIRVESTFPQDMYGIKWGLQITLDNNIVADYSGNFDLFGNSYTFITRDFVFNSEGSYIIVAYVYDDANTRWSDSVTFNVLADNPSTTTSNNSSIPTLANPLPGFEWSAVIPVFVVTVAIVRKRRYNN